MSKLLIISPSLNNGGIERALTVLANQFVEMGINVSFLVCLPGKDHFTLNPKVNLIKPGISYQGKFGKVLFYPKLLNFIRRTTRSIKPEAVLAFGDVFSPLVLLSLYGTQNRVFISDRTAPEFKINPVAQFLKSIFYKSSEGFIAQSQKVLRINEHRFNNKLNQKVIPNAIKQIEQDSSVEKSDSILYVGRLSWEKGVDRLIKAFALIKSENWRLELVGDGPMMETYKEMSVDLGINDQVVFHGVTKDPSKFYNQSKIFVLPSFIEGFPNALCEAMSVGLPVVCFDSIPYESIVKPRENGLIAKADNIQSMSEALKILINDQNLREEIAKNNVEKVKDFEPKFIAKQFLEFMKISV